MWLLRRLVHLKARRDTSSRNHLQQLSLTMNQPDSSQAPKLMLKSTKDALLIIEAAEQGLFPRLVRRLTEQEREQSIYSGAVLVYDEFESHIRRFTDTLVWSPSRIIDNYLVYREMKEREPRPTSRAGAALPPQPSSARSLVRPRTDASLQQNEIERKKKEQLYIGSLTHNERFKPDGLVKRTFSLMTEGKHVHVICYYTLEDAMEDRFLTPSEHPEFSKLSISQDFLKDKSLFRVPPRIERLTDGRLVYAGEEQKRGTSDSERTSVEPDRTSPSTSSADSTTGVPSLPSLALFPSAEPHADSMPELPPLRSLPPARAWDYTPAVDPLAFNRPAYTFQARANTSPYEMDDPTYTHNQLSLPALSIQALTPSPPPSRSVSRLRDNRQNPYPDSRSRPHATNLNIARSLRDTGFNPMNPTFSPDTSPEFAPITPEYHEQLTWSTTQMDINRSGHTMIQGFGYSGVVGGASMRSGVLESSPSHSESRSYECEIGPSGETVEYDPVPAGRYRRTDNPSLE
ncbi:unnamed protein product [Rhizoctonia solani]|uniref:Gti1/Pac2 family-domain-containing protein n=1 Tax=Rhizoctonia solani TaxID=456999 RepID=A0A8H3E5R8_9AGAM|nr:unnamed protein product [Rhizoctonia solani]